MAFNTYINDRLNQWAHWVAQRDSGALGYPHQSAFVRLAGGSGSYSSRLAPDLNERAWEIERAVQSLRGELKECVVSFYCRIGTIEQKARECRCCRDTMYSRLDRAHGLILDALNGYACEDNPPVKSADVLRMQKIA
jgi:hypothetical protein